jgi:hypothetical protein
VREFGAVTRYEHMIAGVAVSLCISLAKRKSTVASLKVFSLQTASHWVTALQQHAARQYATQQVTNWADGISGTCMFVLLTQHG